jgi:transposase
MRDPEDLTGTEAATLAYIQRDPAVTVAHGLARRFVTMIQQQDVEHLDSWLAACAESGISWLITFGKGLTKDYEAVHAALELPWSSAQAEGQINRLKLLKRQMYGRASFPLLRSRVLQAA